MKRRNNIEISDLENCILHIAYIFKIITINKTEVRALLTFLI